MTEGIIMPLAASRSIRAIILEQSMIFFMRRFLVLVTVGRSDSLVVSLRTLLQMANTKMATKQTRMSGPINLATCLAGTLSNLKCKKEKKK